MDAVSTLHAAHRALYPVFQTQHRLTERRLCIVRMTRYMAFRFDSTACLSPVGLSVEDNAVTNLSMERRNPTKLPRFITYWVSSDRLGCDDSNVAAAVCTCSLDIRDHLARMRKRGALFLLVAPHRLLDEHHV